MLILKLKTGKTKEPNIKHLITKSCDVGEQSLFNLWGTGANGKSTFLNVLHLFGYYGCSTGIETFTKKNKEQSNDMARLKGARACYYQQRSKAE